MGLTYEEAFTVYFAVYAAIFLVSSGINELPRLFGREPLTMQRAWFSRLIDFWCCLLFIGGLIAFSGGIGFGVAVRHGG